MRDKPYAFVIGGTGMLERVCHWLVEHNYFVSVLNRNRDKFDKMKHKNASPDNFHPLTVDYHDTEQLQQKVNEAINEFGVPDLVISWIHSSAPEALPTILDQLKVWEKPWKLLHVQGSSSFFVKENTTVPDNCQYRRVYLGFVIEDGGSRWLTHDEIANGVIKVIQRDYKETVVGTLKPWSKRPQ
ncbi:short-chain dehydrogenase [Ornithinibacillus salinisoli]|uniref:Short-chain dehydrogenase n=1 Tax=Ornithinibacillus salinisoli TaxID=1848459 RepID=A0ABW4W0G8_9BACI